MFLPWLLQISWCFTYQPSFLTNVLHKLFTYPTKGPYFFFPLMLSSLVCSPSQSRLFLQCVLKALSPIDGMAILKSTYGIWGDEVIPKCSWRCFHQISWDLDYHFEHVVLQWGDCINSTLLFCWLQHITHWRVQICEPHITSILYFPSFTMCFLCTAYQMLPSIWSTNLHSKY